MAQAQGQVMPGPRPRQGSPWRAAATARITSGAAMTVAVWNPFVVERLLQGQWSLAAAAWLLPLVALGVHPVSTLAHWLASLTPTGALAAAMFARGWRSLTVAVLTCLPWVVAGFAASSPGTSSVAGAAAFAPRAEGHVGTLGALLGLGGIWNGQAVPPSRAAGWALCGIALFALLALGWRAVPRRWLVLAGDPCACRRLPH